MPQLTLKKELQNKTRLFLNLQECVLRDQDTHINWITLKEAHKNLEETIDNIQELSREEVSLLSSCWIQFVNCLHTLSTKIKPKQDDTMSIFNILSTQKNITERLGKLKEDFIEQISPKILMKMNSGGFPPWFFKILMQTFKNCIINTNGEKRRKCFDEIKNTFQKIMEIICTCGDFNYQATLTEIIFRLGNIDSLRNCAEIFFPQSNELRNAFINIEVHKFDLHLRTFLNAVNLKFKSVFSVKCLSIILDKYHKIKEPKGLDKWVDFNLGFESISFYCDKTCLQEDRSSQTGENCFEIVTIMANTISSIFIENFITSDDVNPMHGKNICFLLESPCSCSHASSYKASECLELTIFEGKQLNELEQEILPKFFGDKLFRAPRNNTDSFDTSLDNINYSLKVPSKKSISFLSDTTTIMFSDESDSDSSSKTLNKFPKRKSFKKIQNDFNENVIEEQSFVQEMNNNDINCTADDGLNKHSLSNYIDKNTKTDSNVKKDILFKPLPTMKMSKMSRSNKEFLDLDSMTFERRLYTPLPIYNDIMTSPVQKKSFSVRNTDARKLPIIPELTENGKNMEEGTKDLVTSFKNAGDVSIITNIRPGVKENCKTNKLEVKKTKSQHEQKPEENKLSIVSKNTKDSAKENQNIKQIEPQITCFIDLTEESENECRVSCTLNYQNILKHTKIKEEQEKILGSNNIFSEGNSEYFTCTEDLNNMKNDKQMEKRSVNIIQQNIDNTEVFNDCDEENENAQTDMDITLKKPDQHPSEEMLSADNICKNSLMKSNERKNNSHSENNNKENLISCTEKDKSKDPKHLNEYNSEDRSTESFDKVMEGVNQPEIPENKNLETRSYLDQFDSFLEELPAIISQRKNKKTTTDVEIVRCNKNLERTHDSETNEQSLVWPKSPVISNSSPRNKIRKIKTYFAKASNRKADYERNLKMKTTRLEKLPEHEDDQKQLEPKTCKSSEESSQESKTTEMMNTKRVERLKEHKDDQKQLVPRSGKSSEESSQESKKEQFIKITGLERFKEHKYDQKHLEPRICKSSEESSHETEKKQFIETTCVKRLREHKDDQRQLEPVNGKSSEENLQESIQKQFMKTTRVEMLNEHKDDQKQLVAGVCKSSEESSQEIKTTEIMKTKRVERLKEQKDDQKQLVPRSGKSSEERSQESKTKKRSPENTNNKLCVKVLREDLVLKMKEMRKRIEKRRIIESSSSSEEEDFIEIVTTAQVHAVQEPEVEQIKSDNLEVNMNVINDKNLDFQNENLLNTASNLENLQADEEVATLFNQSNTLSIISSTKPTVNCVVLSNLPKNTDRSETFKTFKKMTSTLIEDDNLKNAFKSKPIRKRKNSDKKINNEKRPKIQIISNTLLTHGNKFDLRAPAPTQKPKSRKLLETNDLTFLEKSILDNSQPLNRPDSIQSHVNPTFPKTYEISNSEMKALKNKSLAEVNYALAKETCKRSFDRIMSNLLKTPLDSPPPSPPFWGKRGKKRFPVRRMEDMTKKEKTKKRYKESHEKSKSYRAHNTRVPVIKQTSNANLNNLIMEDDISIPEGYNSDVNIDSEHSTPRKQKSQKLDWRKTGDIESWIQIGRPVEEQENLVASFKPECESFLNRSTKILENLQGPVGTSVKRWFECFYNFTGELENCINDTKNIEPIENS